MTQCVKNEWCDTGSFYCGRVLFLQAVVVDVARFGRCGENPVVSTGRAAPLLQHRNNTRRRGYAPAGLFCLPGVDLHIAVSNLAPLQPVSLSGRNPQSNSRITKSFNSAPAFSR